MSNNTVNAPDAVIVVLLSPDWPELVPAEPLRVLAVSSARRPPDQLCLPGGKVEPQDDRGFETDPRWIARFAVTRELREETGIRLSAADVTLVGRYTTADGLSVWAYLARRISTGAVPDGLRPEPGCRAVWVEPGDLLKVCPFAETNGPAIEAAVKGRENSEQFFAALMDHLTKGDCDPLLAGLLGL